LANSDVKLKINENRADLMGATRLANHSVPSSGYFESCPVIVLQSCVISSEWESHGIYVP